MHKVYGYIRKGYRTERTFCLQGMKFVFLQGIPAVAVECIVPAHLLIDYDGVIVEVPPLEPSEFVTPETGKEIKVDHLIDEEREVEGGHDFFLFGP